MTDESHRIARLTAPASSRVRIPRPLHPPSSWHDDAFFRVGAYDPPQLEPVRCRREGCNDTTYSLGLCFKHTADQMYREYLEQTRVFLEMFPDRARDFVRDVTRLTDDLAAAEK